jgi:hypothetical protein
MLLAVVFVGVAGVLVLLALLALLRIGGMRMESPLVLLRGGLPRGARAPAWQRGTVDGGSFQVPSGERWQFLVFINHSLVGYPDLVEGIRRLQAEESALEFVLLPKEGEAAQTSLTCHNLELQVSVVAVDERLYWRYNVPVVPWVFLLDPAGVVEASGNVANQEMLVWMWRLHHKAATAAGTSAGSHP